MMFMLQQPRSVYDICTIKNLPISFILPSHNVGKELFLRKKRKKLSLTENLISSHLQSSNIST